MITKKPLPKPITKNVLENMYGDQFSNQNIRKKINEILKEANVSLGTRILQLVHVREFIETYGEPRDYDVQEIM